MLISLIHTNIYPTAESNNMQSQKPLPICCAVKISQITERIVEQYMT